jgi:hypothetical protein
MTLWPDWNSLTSVKAWHTVFEIAGIGILALLVGAEILAYTFGKRQEVLAEQAERIRVAAEQQRYDNAERRHAEEVATLRAKLDEATSQVTDDHSLKGRIRRLFDSVDPQIVREIDGGSTELAVRMPIGALQSLAQLLREDGAEELLKASQTGKTWGPGVTINNGSLGPQGSGASQYEIRVVVSPGLRSRP